MFSPKEFRRDNLYGSPAPQHCGGANTGRGGGPAHRRLMRARKRGATAQNALSETNGTPPA